MAAPRHAGRKDIGGWNGGLACNSLSQIRDGAGKFWEARSVPAQMPADKEVVLAVARNGRIDAIQDDAVPALVQWREGMRATDVWAIPKGAKNDDNAMKPGAVITLPVSRAGLSMLTPHGFVNDNRPDLTLDDQLEIKGKMFNRDPQSRADSTETVTERWNLWILG